MDNKELADELLENFIQNKKYVNIDMMREDIVKLLQKYGPVLIVEGYWKHEDKLFNILMINEDYSSHLSDQLSVMLITQFDKRFVCPVCNKSKRESEMKECRKCNKMVCSAYKSPFNCAKDIYTGFKKPGDNYIHFCKPCLKKMYE